MTDTQELVALYTAMAGDIGDPLPEDEWTQGLGFFIRTYNFLSKNNRVRRKDELVLQKYYFILTTLDSALYKIREHLKLLYSRDTMKGLLIAEDVLMLMKHQTGKDREDDQTK